MAGNQYDGVSCTALPAYTERGGRFGEDETTKANTEAPIELLPYVALGWAPECSSGTDHHCAPRALARSLQIMLQFHKPGYRFSDSCSFHKFVEMFACDEFKHWRLDRQREDPRYHSVVVDQRELWSSTGGNYYNQDVMYLLGYISYKQFLPIKFRLGLIRKGPWRYNEKKGRGKKITNYEITEPVDNWGTAPDDAPHPVLWLLFPAYTLGPDADGHYESIGPDPSHDGLHLFHLWGLEEPTRDMVKHGIFYVSEEGFENAERQRHRRGKAMLQRSKHTWLYKHPAHQTEIHAGYVTHEEYPFGITPRSDFHDKGWVQNRSRELPDETATRGYIYTLESQHPRRSETFPLDTYPSERG